MLYLVALFAYLFPTGTPAGKKSALVIDVQNIRQLSCSVQIGLFKPCDDFPGGCKPVENRIIAVTQKSVQASFDVEPGRYAVALFHDTNGNGKMDKKAFGIPKEPYGFSNNFKPRFSGPSFADCQVTVGEGGKTIQISLIQ